MENIYIVGLNENLFLDSDGNKIVFDELDVCKAKLIKTIQTESIIDGLTPWESSEYMPNVGGSFLLVAEAQEALAVKKLADKESLKVDYQTKADMLIQSKYGISLVQIFPTATGEKAKLAQEFVLAVSNHALEVANAIDSDSPYEFNLSQFICDVTPQEIQTEIAGA